MAKKKTFLCIYDCNMGETELKFHHMVEGLEINQVIAEHEVEHEGGLDTEDSPIGGACGQYHTELISVVPITPAQKKFLNEIGIH
jgi:hypothetical protein